MTVNCARIIHGNQVATNGVVHVVDRVITVATNTIREVLETRDELSSFNVRKCMPKLINSVQKLFKPNQLGFVLKLYALGKLSCFLCKKNPSDHIGAPFNSTYRSFFLAKINKKVILYYMSIY